MKSPEMLWTESNQALWLEVKYTADSILFLQDLWWQGTTEELPAGFIAEVRAKVNTLARVLRTLGFNTYWDKLPITADTMEEISIVALFAEKVFFKNRYLMY